MGVYVLPALRELHVTKDQLALHYGVSVRTVDRLRREGMPWKPIGSSVRFLISETDAWFSERSGQQAAV